MRAVVVLMAAFEVAGRGGTVASQPQTSTARVFDCRTFPRELAEADLGRRYGALHVTAGPVPVGEGMEEDGTTLFAASDADRVTILWKDKAGRRRPDSISVRAGASTWRTPDGIGIGTELTLLERLNRRPFRLLGFGWDYGGTVMSWSGGRLDTAADEGCRLRLRLSPTHGSSAERAVIGEREFSSGHPAMQQLNPRVYEMLLFYPDRS